MKKMFTTLVVAAALTLTGCATPMTMKERNKAQIQAVKQVQIIYPAQDNFYVTYEGGGTSIGSVSGMFGPLGSLIGAAVDLASTAGTAQQKINRSEEFTNKALAVNSSPAYMNELVVSKLKAELESKGYKVVTTRVEVPKDKDFLTLLNLGDKLEGYSTLAIRTNTGYYSKNVTKPYNPDYTVRYALSMANTQLLDGVETKLNAEKSYNSYEDIMADFNTALGILKTDLEPVGKVVFEKIFVFPAIAK